MHLVSFKQVAYFLHSLTFRAPGHVAMWYVSEWLIE